MFGFDCEDDSCLANIGGICTAGKADGCEGYAIGDEEYDEDALEIDHEYTGEIVCPACGYEFGDSWESFLDGTHSETEEECPECGAKFKVTQNVEVTYSTELIEEEQP